MQSSQTGAKKALSVVASIALAFAGTVGMSSVAHAADAGKVYLNFEGNDNLGAAVSGFEGATTTIEASPAAVGGVGGDDGVDAGIGELRLGEQIDRRGRPRNHRAILAPLVGQDRGAGGLDREGDGLADSDGFA